MRAVGCWVLQWIAYLTWRCNSMHVLSNHHVQMGTAEDKTHGTSNSAENDVEGGISVTSCFYSESYNVNDVAAWYCNCGCVRERIIFTSPALWPQGDKAMKLCNILWGDAVTAEQLSQPWSMRVGLTPGMPLPRPYMLRLMTCCSGRRSPELSISPTCQTISLQTGPSLYW